MKYNKKAPLLDKVYIKFGDFLTSLPSVPLIDPAPAFNYPMDKNDSWGDCCVAGYDHFNQIVTGLLIGTQVNFTEAKILAFYQTQNPGFNPAIPGVNDNGMCIQTFLEYLQKNKYIVGFGRIDYTNTTEVKAAIYIGLALIGGVQLQQAQETQFAEGQLWNLVVDSPVLGGHCIVPCGYFGQTDTYSSITWGKIQNFTKDFLTQCFDELWFVITQEHIDHPNFRNHFDLAGFAQAVKAITDGKVIIPVYPTLKLGSTGSSVVTLQKDLNKDLGITLITDGSFGKLTLNAVKAFQSKYHLKQDGIVGQKTWTAFQMIDIITTTCNSNGIDPILGIAVAVCESGLDPLSTLFNPGSKSTDRGLFQWASI